MTDHSLVKLFEHNNWANLKVIEACLSLDDQQLDAEPKSATYGSIRTTLSHLVNAQRGYLRLLTLPVEERRERIPPAPFGELKSLANGSGEALLALARKESMTPSTGRLQTTDGFFVEAWVIMLQIINHATEHREQIKNMLSAIGATPPEIDGWSYAESMGGMIPVEGNKA